MVNSFGTIPVSCLRIVYGVNMQRLVGRLAVAQPSLCVCALTPTSLWGNSCVQDGVMGCAYVVG